MTPRNQLSRMVMLEPWPEEGVAFEVDATGDERAGVAGQLDLVGLPRLRFAGAIERAAFRDGYVLKGLLEAEVIQRCVVTLEPLTARITEPVERHYGLGMAVEAEAVELDEEALDEIDVEPLVAPLLDVGEVAVEELALALDPYPRSPEADAVVAAYAPEGDEDAAVRPFDILKRLKS